MIHPDIAEIVFLAKWLVFFATCDFAPSDTAVFLAEFRKSNIMLTNRYNSILQRRDVLKKALNAIEGVSIAKPSKKKKCGLDEALDDVKAGRVHHADNEMKN